MTGWVRGPYVHPCSKTALENPRADPWTKDLATAVRSLTTSVGLQLSASTSSASTAFEGFLLSVGFLFFSSTAFEGFLLSVGFLFFSLTVF
jgi:hypothetical protein